MAISQDEADRLNAKLAELANRRVRIPGARRRAQDLGWLFRQEAAQARMAMEMSKAGRR